MFWGQVNFTEGFHIAINTADKRTFTLTEIKIRL